MSDNRFDDFLKESFSDYSPEVPGHIWENIAASKQKRRPGFFWFNSQKILVAAASLLLLGGGVYYFSIRPGNNTQNKNIQDIAHENNSSRQDAGNTVPAPVLNNREEKNNNASGSHENPAPADNDLPVTAPVKENGTAPSHDKAFAKGSNGSGVTQEDGEVNYKSVSKTGKRQSRLNRASLKANTAIPPVDDAGTDDRQAGTSTTAGQDLHLPDVAGRRDLIKQAIENLLTKKTIQANPVKLRDDCPGNTSGNNYYFDAYLGPDHVIKKYSDTGNSVLVTRRKESLKIQSAYSAGIRYTRVFSNGMSIRAGVNYSLVNEKFSYAVDNVVQIVYVINNQGDTTDSYYVRGTRYRNSYNRYRTIDVPVVMGYEMGNGNFHANVNAGLMVNVYSWQNGETLDNNGTPVSITTGKPDNPYQYKTNIGLGFTGAVSLYYKLGNRFHVMAEPYFRYNLTPMNKEAISLQERFTTIGLRLGIRVDIK